MKYQLVVQFTVTDGDNASFEELVAVEDRLAMNEDGYEVDGHDIGSGQMNIFMLTDAPQSTLAEIRAALPAARSWIAAYRPIDGETYVVLERSGIDHFEIK